MRLDVAHVSIAASFFDKRRLKNTHLKNEASYLDLSLDGCKIMDSPILTPAPQDVVIRVVIAASNSEDHKVS
jgi:hypothetical protein